MAAVILALLGCSPLQSGSYPGEPHFVIGGEIFQDVSLPGGDGSPTVAILWAVRDELPLQHDRVEVSTQFPSRYELTGYDDPPDEALGQGPPGTDEPLAVGTVVLFQDRDGEGLLDWGDEPVVGAAPDLVVHWTQPDGFRFLWAAGDCGQYVAADVLAIELHVPQDVCDVLYTGACGQRALDWGTCTH